MTRSTRVAHRFPAAMAMLLILLAFPSMGAAASPPGIWGRVVDATHHRPVAGQPVTLATFRGETRLSTAESTTDGRGAFSFDPAPSKATGFQVLTTFQGGTFRSPITQLTDPIPPATVKVFAPTTDPATIAQTNWVVWVDPMPGGIVVQQDFTWKNDGSTAYIGPDARGGVVTEVPLSPAATNVQYLGSYLNGGGRIVGNTYQGSQPIVPGKSNGTVRYVVATLDSLRLVSPLATGNLHVFVPTDLTVFAPAMTSAGQITDRGTTYRVLTAANIPAQRVVTVGLTAAPSAKTTAWPFAVAGFIILMIVVALSVRRVRKGGRQQRRMMHLPRTSMVPSDRRPSRDPSRDAASPDETEVLLEEIAAIDVAFEEGLLEPATYERVRAAAKERLATAARDPSRS
jgi:hypothetical protein